jgi:DNA polymerase elongation subunit (family B)
VPLHELVLTYHLSRDPKEYQTDTLNAIVARELAGRGVTLNPGESVRYVITEYQADVPSDRARAWEFIDGSWGYDVARYTELLMRAVESVFTPFGVSASMLRSWLVKELPAEHLRARLEANKRRAYLGPLFELALPSGTVRSSSSQTR